MSLLYFALHDAQKLHFQFLITVPLNYISGHSFGDVEQFQASHHIAPFMCECNITNPTKLDHTVPPTLTHTHTPPTPSLMQ